MRDVEQDRTTSVGAMTDSDTPLGDVMITRVVAIRPQEAASVAWTRMRRRNIRHLVVMDAGQVVGVLSERDLGGRTRGGGRAGRTVRDLMTSSVVTANPSTTLREAATVMRRRLIGSLPVLDGDTLVGIVTATDVLDALGRGAARHPDAVERELLRRPTSSRRLGGRSSEPLTPRGGRQPRRTVLERLPAARAPEIETPSISILIRAMGVGLDERSRERIRGTLSKRLEPFSSAIERVSVRVRDENGPRGGLDKTCQITVALTGLPSVVFEAREATIEQAIDGAMTGVRLAVRRAVQRRRTKPLRRGDEADEIPLA